MEDDRSGFKRRQLLLHISYPEVAAESASLNVLMNTNEGPHISSYRLRSELCTRPPTTAPHYHQSSMPNSLFLCLHSSKYAPFNSLSNVTISTFTIGGCFQVLGLHTRTSPRHARTTRFYCDWQEASHNASRYFKADRAESLGTYHPGGDHEQ